MTLTLTRRLAAVVGACTLAAGLATAPVHADDPPAPARLAARLSCQPRVEDGAPAAVCEWRLRADGASAVELWRGTGHDGELNRVKVFGTEDLTVTRYVDTSVQAGQRYAYVLIVLGPEGNERGRSNLSGVSFVPPKEVEHLRLACHRTAVAKVVHCEWGAPASDDAAKITLFVLVDRGGRQALVTLEPAAAGGFDYTAAEGTRLVRFAVVSFDAAGEVDGRSRVVPITFARPRR